MSRSPDFLASKRRAAPSRRADTASRLRRIRGNRRGTGTASCTGPLRPAGRSTRVPTWAFSPARAGPFCRVTRGAAKKCPPSAPPSAPRSSIDASDRLFSLDPTADRALPKPAPTQNSDPLFSTPGPSTTHDTLALAEAAQRPECADEGEWRGCKSQALLERCASHSPAQAEGLFARGSYM